MVSFRKALLFGFLIWVIAFLVAFAIFPLRENARPLFESIMPVILSVVAVFFGLRYFRGVETAFVREGVLLGILWLAVNVVIDLPLMLTGPIAMSPSEYVGDIGLTYVILPVITSGLGASMVLARTAASRGRTADPAETS